MGSRITAEMLRLVRLSMYQLRQDIGVPDTVEEAESDTSVVWQKCLAYYPSSFDAVLSAHNWTWKRGNDDVLESVDTWPEEAKSLLVYHLAKELSVTVAGRVEDMKNLTTIYEQKLHDARVHDLDAELDAIQDPDEKEILAAVCPTITTGGAALPMDLITVTRRIDANKAHAMAEIISSHNWSFCRDEVTVGSMMCDPTGDYPFSTDLPAKCVRPLDCRGSHGCRVEWKLIGRTIRSSRPIDTILYIKNESRLDRWPPLVRKAYVSRIVSDIAATVAGSSAEANRLRQMYERDLEDARLADSRGTGTHREQRGRNFYADAMTRPGIRSPFGRGGFGW